jgi:hypothetical protein
VLVATVGRMQRQFSDDGFEFDRLILLGGASRGLSDVGEVLAALDRVTDGDHDSWIDAFSTTGRRLSEQADASERQGSPVSARSARLRASNYFASAATHAVALGDDERVHQLWERHRSLWDAAVAAFDTPADQVEIAYEDTTLPGYFFRPAGADLTRRPTVVLNNGSDGPVCDMWSAGAAAAVERGWNALVFDGPGQGAALYRQQLHFRADWEAVITPVLDHLVARDDVDPQRIALIGISQGGYWVPRAAAHEARLAACVADPGVVRVGDSWRSHLPDVMLQLLDQGDQEDFDAFMEAGLADEPAALAELRWRMAPYGTTSYFEAYRAAQAMELNAQDMAAIGCPLLVTAPDHEQFWPGQSQELHDGVRGAELVAFTEAEGGAWHCEPVARALRDERVFDWLAAKFSAVAGG